MTINAGLERLVLSSPNAPAAASFYHDTFGYRVETVADTVRCEAPGRSLWWVAGPANQLVASHFRFESRSDLDRYAAQLSTRGVCVDRVGNDSAIELYDPEGRQLRFAYWSPESGVQNPDRPARIQHYGVRSNDPDMLLEFYMDKIGFTASDLVRDERGLLTAAFLRTNEEHHVLAIFRGASPCFDHFSCETESWITLRAWADHVTSSGSLLAWGIGRHGPGNDTFFMVKDPDGNLAEISSDLEVCSDGRPVGVWPHRAETLNRWGTALLRC